MSIESKLARLLETKREFRSVIDKYSGINEDEGEMPFSLYPAIFDSIIETQVGNFPRELTNITEIASMKFVKSDDNYNSAVTVTLPHTCNTVDAATHLGMFRGDTYYYFDFTAEADTEYLVQFEQVGQLSKVYLNDNLLHENRFGYTPFAVKLVGVNVGQNRVKIKCTNTINYDMIPLSADFNFANGMLGKAYLIASKAAYFDPTDYGIDRAHVVPSKIDVESGHVELEVRACVTGACGEGGQVNVIAEVWDADEVKITSSSCMVNLFPGSTKVAVPLEFDGVNLWSHENPYLYRIKAKISVNGFTLDNLDIPYGFRKLDMPSPIRAPLKINGIPTVLRGVCMHQDDSAHGQALTDEDMARDMAIIRNLGCNYMRLAHYPHNVRELRLFDENGIYVQTEIPWVNNYGYASTVEYERNIYDYAREMIKNLYNHPAILFWGISNEISNVGEPIRTANGENGLNNCFSTDVNEYTTEARRRYIDIHNRVHRRMKELDPYRLVGYVSCNPRQQSECYLLREWVGYNIYPGWYTDIPDDLTNANVNVGASATAVYGNRIPIAGISEYGGGGNPYHHNNAWGVTHKSSTTNEDGTSVGSGGTIHPEEYQTMLHRKQYRSIEAVDCAFSTVWVLFDFACTYRNEGNAPGINDKGLATRDRSIMKDAFYYYKARWSDEKFVHLNETKWGNPDFADPYNVPRNSDSIVITAFGNTDGMKLYRYENGSWNLLQTKNSPTEPGFWQFDEVYFATTNDKFKVSGIVNGTEICEDAGFMPTTCPVNPYISTNPESLSLMKDAGQTVVTVMSNRDWTITSCPSWITPSANVGTAGTQQITLTYTETTSVRDGNIVFTPVEGDAVTLAVHQTNSYFQLSRNLVEFETSNAESDSVTVLSNVQWTVTECPGWVSLSQNGGNLTISASENTVDEARSGTITIHADGLGDFSITVRQAAKLIYTPLLCLISDASDADHNAYINTGWTYDTSDTVEVMAQTSGGVNAAILGCRKSSTQAAYTLHVNGGSFEARITDGDAVARATVNASSYVDKVNTYIMSGYDGNGLTVTSEDGTSKTAAWNTTFASPAVSNAFKIFLFAVYSQFTTPNYADMRGVRKIFYVKITDRNSVLKHHLIPVLDKNNVPCMLDLVTKEFHYAALGSFLFDREVSFSLSGNRFIVDSASQSATLTVESNSDWEISASSADFVTVSPMSGTAGTTPVTLTFTANPGNGRSGALEFSVDGSTVKHYVSIAQKSAGTYTPVKYIEANSAQSGHDGYILTDWVGINLSKHTILTEGELGGTDSISLFGSRETASTKRLTLNRDVGNGIFPNCSNTANNYIKTNTYGNLAGANLIVISSAGMFIVPYGQGASGSPLPWIDAGQIAFDTVYPMCILGTNQSGTINNKSGRRRIYSFQISEEDTPVHSLIPVLDGDGVPCMYDTVEGKFWYNEMEGNTFLYGEA